MLEQSCIPTDMSGVENFVDKVLQEIESTRKLKFFTLAFTPSVRNPAKMLHDLQHSEIGSYFNNKDEILKVLPI
jgi:hypothetical protein